MSVSFILKAWLLSKCFAEDNYSSLYFQRGLYGDMVRTMFFLDELKLRSQKGLILTYDTGVALVGLYPYYFLQKQDLTYLTKCLISLQKEPYASRWNEAWLRMVSPTEKHLAYLSAIACPDKSRNNGIGTKILRDLSKVAAERGLAIFADATSEDLAHWYMKRGFYVEYIYYLGENVPIFRIKSDSSPSSDQFE